MPDGLVKKYIYDIDKLVNIRVSKPEIVVPGSGIRFRYFIFEISGKPSFDEAVFYDELRRFSTFFALNFTHFFFFLALQLPVLWKVSEIKRNTRSEKKDS
jgi:hypothetical protein